MTKIWLGSDDSFTQHLLRQLAIIDQRPELSAQEQALRVKLDEQGLELSDYLCAQIVEQVGNVGIVRIAGSLVSEESFYNPMFGQLAYQTIENAIATHLSNPSVSNVLTIWDTPGGDASGIYDFGTFIKDARKVKPITAWTGTMALSAGYWGAACCDAVHVSALAEVGSIGAVAKFRSYSKLLSDEGIETLIARSAPAKALLQSEEPIDEKKRAYLQEKVDKLHTYFVEHVKAARPALRDIAESKWASGASFFPDDARALGLIDGPDLSLSALVSKLQARADKAQNKGNRNMNMTVLSDQVVAQMMSGIAGAVPEVAEVQAEPEQVEQVEPKLETTVETTELQAIPDGLTTYLQGKVAELEGKVTELTLKADKAESKLAEVTSLEETLRPVVLQATKHLQVALGQSPSEFEGVPSRAIAATYHQLSAEAQKRFPVGRQSVQGQDASRQATSLAELRLISSAK